MGSASFMHLMEITLPQGLNVKNAVFCAIDGELAGIFALNYTLHGALEPSLNSLIRNRVTPVMATRDFNLIPAMLRQRFKLPVDKMEFPAVERRRELSDEEQPHSDILTAVLCREGVAPYSEAVVGAAGCAGRCAPPQCWPAWVLWRGCCWPSTSPLYAPTPPCPPPTCWCSC